MAVREIVAAAVSDPAAMMRAIGEPERGGVFTLHHSERLTVLNLVWGPGMDLMPHDHRMWAAIGIYTGRATTVFWRSGANGLPRLGETTVDRKSVRGDRGMQNVWVTGGA